MFKRTDPGPQRNRYVPFRVLAVLQFGVLPELLLVPAPGQIEITSVPLLARKLRLRVSALVSALEWLQAHNYISGYSRTVVPGKGSTASLCLSQPLNLGSAGTYSYLADRAATGRP